ncbi:heme ABC transporter ATP-binding protein [Streptococcus azizii]|uniref:Heme ABC transporter ATP-binding protein n=1 Tax=Streptococcus azizii TaxID=1579424 RepID=A0AB36JJU7_9STRE|nr:MULTISPECIES: ABC transporter ATP-binding protein [Streptococcus]MBF0776854.1 ABC transporter ATP-binding protein [Streptococcus sp. 19428wD3_AN2]ONK25568.1 heme ABC transporter ATP-binding protein [Streptococcus azizii]ONK25927.1 heme ABC transporter ATP-binding protein [Streptococcus azizii]ONK26225.1 heme ABC transporter ATP-binding protein [Streptococcus azizii]TFU82288.1 ABC transporter ATP-binding protein [Streptococcus sp. AN2]
MKKAIVEFENFSFKYSAQQEATLQEIDLTIYQGEKVLIVGPSGSGKSTLGQCLNGIIPNIYQGTRTGSLKIDGKDAFEQSIYEKSLIVSTVLQDTDGQFIGLSVAEDLAFALENDVIPVEEMKERIQVWANRLELQNLLTHRPQALSGGQKQRVSLAGVLIDESPILLFDEPLANLDPKSGQDTIALIDSLHKEQEATTIIIEHRLEDVLYRQVDRIVLINEGRILYNGAPDSLLRSTLLLENGIREPLYVTTLRQLGYDLEKEVDLTSVEGLTLADIQVEDLPGLAVKERAGSPLVEVQHLQVSYGEKEVLKDITLSIYAGERLAIIGKNGAGKSTLAKALCQFLEVSGEVLWNGQSVLTDSIKERAERIGYVLQNPNQMISQTMIFDEVALGLRLRGVAEEEVTEKVEATLRICGLYPFRKWPISALSFGQKKRVTIASILVLNPEIILLDEPTAGQDQRNYTEIMDFLDELNRQGHTIIMITHDMQLMLDYSDRSIVLVDGQLVADAHPASILTDQTTIEAANLKETSIFHLAEKLGVDALALTQFYMTRERTE